MVFSAMRFSHVTGLKWKGACLGLFEVAKPWSAGVMLMVNLGSQLDWGWKQLNDKPWGTAVG